jgi:purine nucleoside permease
MFRTKLKRYAVFPALLAAFVTFGSQARADDGPLEIRFVVVTTFDTGTDTNGPGEFQSWVVNFPLDKVLPFPQGYHHLRYNESKHVLGIETGEGPNHMAASITALVNDKRFDFTHAYWILAGIAGIDPTVGPVASAAWAHYIIDGGLAYQIDSREMPAEWPTGYIPLGRSAPYLPPTPPASSINGVNLFTLNRPFVDWAYKFSYKHVTLPDTANLQTVRAQYPDYPNTQAPPEIMRGDVVGSPTFWIGKLLNTWAEGWTSYWTQGKGTFTMTSEEDAGYGQALTFLAQVNAIDFNRVLVLRSGSDFTVPPTGKTPYDLLLQDATGVGYSGFIESLADVYLAGASVVNEIADHWGKYKDTVPTVDMPPFPYALNASSP